MAGDTSPRIPEILKAADIDLLVICTSSIEPASRFPEPAAF